MSFEAIHPDRIGAVPAFLAIATIERHRAVEEPIAERRAGADPP